MPGYPITIHFAFDHSCSAIQMTSNHVLGLKNGVAHSDQHLVCLWAPFGPSSNQHDSLRAAGLEPLSQPKFPDHQPEIWPALASRAGTHPSIMVDNACQLGSGPG